MKEIGFIVLVLLLLAGIAKITTPKDGDEKEKAP